MLKRPAMSYHRNPAIYAAELDGEVCLFDPVAAAYFNLNSTGSTIWNLLETPLTYDEILGVLLATYPVEAEMCRDQCLHFFTQALELGLLQLAP